MAYRELTKEMLENDCGLVLEGENIYLIVKRGNQWHRKGDKVLLEPHYIKISQNYDIGILNVHNSKTNSNLGSSYARIKWALKYGYVPSDMEVDHIDLDTHNNNFDNLRLITKEENLLNKRCFSNQYIVNWDEEKKRDMKIKRERLENYKKTKLKLKAQIVELETMIKCARVDLQSAREALASCCKNYREEMEEYENSKNKGV